jgi:hypothetical protein
MGSFGSLVKLNGCPRVVFLNTQAQNKITKETNYIDLYVPYYCTKGI